MSVAFFLFILIAMHWLSWIFLMIFNFSRNFSLLFLKLVSALFSSFFPYELQWDWVELYHLVHVFQSQFWKFHPFGFLDYSLQINSVSLIILPLNFHICIINLAILCPGEFPPLNRLYSAFFLWVLSMLNINLSVIRSQRCLCDGDGGGTTKGPPPA